MDPSAYAKSLSDTLDRELEANADLIRPALTAADIVRNRREGFLSAIKTIEEGAVHKGSPDLVQFFYERGVRKSTLTWNFENELAFPNRAVRVDMPLNECTLHGEIEHPFRLNSAGFPPCCALRNRKAVF